MLAALFTYTVFFSLFVAYLVYLRYTNVVQYTEKLYNLHFFVLVVYTSAFLVSALLTFSVYALELTDAALAEVFKFILLDPSMEPPLFLYGG